MCVRESEYGCVTTAELSIRSESAFFIDSCADCSGSGDSNCGDNDGINAICRRVYCGARGDTAVCGSYASGYDSFARGVCGWNEREGLDVLHGGADIARSGIHDGTLHESAFARCDGESASRWCSDIA